MKRHGIVLLYIDSKTCFPDPAFTLTILSASRNVSQSPPPYKIKLFRSSRSWFRWRPKRFHFSRRKSPKMLSRPKNMDGFKLSQNWSPKNRCNEYQKGESVSIKHPYSSVILPAELSSEKNVRSRPKVDRFSSIELLRMSDDMFPS